MPGPQHWPLSQEANKASGTCSECGAVRQLHIKDGTIHKHGPRSAPCPGSHKPPVTNAPTPVPCAASVSSLAAAPVVSLPQVLHPAASAPVNSSLPDWAVASRPLVKHIPRSARPACATHLSELLRSVASNPFDLDAWKAVLSWGRLMLGLPKRGGKRHNLGNIIKKRVSSFSTDNDFGQDESLGNMKRSHQACLADAVAAKIEDGNIRAAVRLLCSDEKPADFSSASLAKLQAKHPEPCPDREPVPDPRPTPSLNVDEADVWKTLRSFPAGILWWLGWPTPATPS